MDSEGCDQGFSEWYPDGVLQALVALRLTFVLQTEFFQSIQENFVTQAVEGISKQVCGGVYPYCTDDHPIHCPPILQRSLPTQLPGHEDHHHETSFHFTVLMAVAGALIIGR